jgi:SAM-dependent methyltransferase
MSDTVFEQYSSYYDLLYRDKDYAAEAGYIADILNAAGGGVRSVLDLGSGTGRHGRLLAAKGYKVFGVEVSEGMVNLARQAEPPPGPGSFDCMTGDVRDVELGTRFDAVLSLFHVVSYQTSNADVLRMFAVAAKHLSPGGVFFFDVWHGPAVLTARPSVRVKRMEDDAIRLTRIAEPEMRIEENVVTVHYTMLVESKSNGKLTEFQEHHPMRYYFPVEIDLIARQTGFRVERSEEFLTGRSAGESTWGVAYVLRKDDQTA